MRVTSDSILRALEKRHIQRRQPDLFFTEVCSGSAGSRRLDAVAIKPSWASPRITGYEVKVNRQDFLGDHKWPAYLEACHVFYFVAPVGLIDPAELDPKVGLITYNPEKESLRTAKKAVFQNVKIGWRLLYSILINRVESDRYPFHNGKAEFFRDWLENKRELRDLGRAVTNKMTQELRRLERENERLLKQIEFDKRTEDRAEDELRGIQEVILKEFGRCPYSKGLAQHLRDGIAQGKSRLAGPETRETVAKARQALEELEGQLADCEKGAMP